jgi:asparagine synthase (glutamine-hydrolysing)
MCGICGVLSQKADDGSIAPLTKAMSDSLAHRGPDGSGNFSSHHIALGHRRLAIIDLVTGDQPMLSSDKRYALVFNGEIYNYIELREELRSLGRKFRTTSDTEVLLQAFEQWGSSCISKLNGMWAFAIWDDREKRLFLSRDRFGIKPLYYAINDDKFLFASEPKALLASGSVERTVNRRIVYDYLAFTITGHTSETFLEGISQLLPGHSMSVDRSLQPKIERFWQLPKSPKPSDKSDNSLIGEFKELFSDAVRLRLRSDVPVGSCLSGGIDSTSIVCTAQNMLKDADGKIKRMETFSAIFKGSNIDESRFIKETEGRIGTNSHYVAPRKEGIFADLEDFVRSQDEPIITASPIAQCNVMRLANENKVKVLLDGQGADETLGGYTRFISSRAADLFLEGETQKASQTLMNTRSNLMERSAVALLFMSMISKGRMAEAIERLFKFVMSFKATDPKSAMHEDLLSEGRSRSFDRFQKKPPYLFSSLSFSTDCRLQELLRYEDRNSMRYSIETRLPFLDYRLVSFEFSTLPDSLKINEFWTKKVLREAMAGVIPDMIRNRKDKIGFDVPESDWVGYFYRNGGLRLLSDKPRIVSFRIIDEAFLTRFVDTFPKCKDWRFAWRLLNLEIWLRAVIENQRGMLPQESKP